MEKINVEHPPAMPVQITIMLRTSEKSSNAKFAANVSVALAGRSNTQNRTSNNDIAHTTPARNVLYVPLRSFYFIGY